MIQDLTVNKEFIKPNNVITVNRSFSMIDFSTLSDDVEWDLVSVIETGDYRERRETRHMKKLHDNIIGESLSCERCGDPITRTPWNFGANRSYLCNKCIEELEAIYGEGSNNNLLRGNRPWDVKDKENGSRPLDDIFLWD